MRYLTFFIFSYLLLYAQHTSAQIPDTLWMKTLGGSNIDIGHSVQQTSDGGFIVAGYSRSYGLMSGRNAWLIKTDADGNEEWNSAFGGDQDDEAYSVQQTDDGGYVLTGYTKSFGLGLNDVLLIKTDSSGNSEWIRTFGGAEDDEGYCLDRTADGGYIVAGVTSSSGAGSRDVFLIKTDPAGNAEWIRTLGGFSSDGARGVQQTSDGGYIVTGWTFSNGPGFLGNAWLVKTDSSGIEEWNRAFGGTDADRGYSVQQTYDGGYILTGYTGSSGAGLYDLLLIRTDSSGNQIWNKTFGGSGRDYGHSVKQTTDGGFIVTGYTLSFGAGGDDLWLIKTDGNGNEEWENTFGGNASDVGYEVDQTSDGGYIVTGHTLSSGAGLHDVYLIRLAAPALPLFTVNTDSLWLGSITAGDTLHDSLTVENSGSAVLVIDSVVSSNSAFSMSPVSATLEPDSVQIFTIQFSTSSFGSHTAILRFYHNGSSSPDSVFVQAEVLTAIAGDGKGLPDQFTLFQIFPNPFNESTKFRIQISKPGFVTLKIYNIIGEEIATLLSASLLSGSHSVTFDASDLASGLYLVRMESRSEGPGKNVYFQTTRKMILAR